MDKNAIKKYAVWAREELIKRVSTKAEEYGVCENNIIPYTASAIGEKILTSSEKEQRKSLIALVEEKGFDRAMEEVAYTWFNRFIALRFMEVNGYLTSRVRVFTNENNEFKPQILDEAIHIELDGLDIDKVMTLKDENKTDELYKYLIITQCNDLHRALPQMFQKISHYTELLFPDNIRLKGSAIEQMIEIIPEDSFKETVEIIGWLYQYYNEERKNEVVNIYKGVVSKNDIPAATQLFTTDWVVRYMVDNSLGKYWLERNPNSKLAEKLGYFVTPKNGEINYINENISPTDLTFFDPCMGSGHVLVYAFDILVEIYLECGYSERDAVKSIIENNIFGLDIDDRAYQLAYFALMMKARSYDRRFLTREITPQVYCPQNDEELENYGSIFIVGELGEKPQEPQELTLFNNDWKKELNNWNFKRLLSQKYAVVCTNPPYLNKYNPTLKKYVTDNYKDYSGDLFSVFIYKNFDYCKQDGYSAFMTPFVWMFIKTYEKLRNYIINSKSITSLVQMEYSAFEEATVPICSFILKNGKENEKGLYFKLSDFKGGMEVQKQKVLAALDNKECGYFYETTQENFSKIPSSPIAYWVSEKMLNSFTNRLLIDLAYPKQGFATGDNNRFLRLWHETDLFNIVFDCKSIDESKEISQKWYPCNKGGGFRRWYGNNNFVANWKNDGFEMKEFKGSVIRNPQFYYQEGMTWSTISSGKLSMRYSPKGFVFETKGSVCFPKDYSNLFYLLGLMNSDIVSELLLVLSPTLDYHEGPLGRTPVIIDKPQKPNIEKLVEQNISLSKTDWDSFETSWDFEKHPLLQETTIQKAFENWETHCKNRFDTLKANEEELNRIFIDIYDLADELTPEVADKDVTVRLADKTRDVKSLISYAVGCVFGRYSLDVDGLAFAGGEFDSSKYTSFTPDTDNIIPICDDEYFADDIVGRFITFVETVYGAETLEKNLSFIASALTGKGSSRDVIRNYFLKNFYDDHCKTYQKRPIYWLYDSGKKNGFKALIYMHRYESDTMARIRTDYVHEQQGRYRTAIADIENRLVNAETSEKVSLNKKLTGLKDQETEIRIFEEKVHHLADQMIKIDLDDGVKNNYEIFKDVLSKIK